MNPTRNSIFTDASKKMRADFEDARNNVPHKGEAGGEGESIVRYFLDDHLPKRYKTTKGFILDKRDQVSPQLDVILYDSLNCPVYRTSKQGMIIACDNAASVLEVKFTLTSQSLGSAFDLINEIKQLVKTPLVSGNPTPELVGTYGVIFAFNSKLSDKQVIKIWCKKLTDSIPFYKSVNMIVILDKGIYIPMIRFPNGESGPIDMEGVSPAPSGSKIGLVFMPFKEETLDHMMRLILGHLNFFRQRIDHPGFNFSQFGILPVKIIAEYDVNGNLVSV